MDPKVTADAAETAKTDAVVTMKTDAPAAAAAAMRKKAAADAVEAAVMK